MVYLDDYLSLLEFKSESFEFVVSSTNSSLLRIFQKVRVKLSMGDEIDLSRRKVLATLVEPVLPALSMELEKKRKNNDQV